MIQLTEISLKILLKYIIVFYFFYCMEVWRISLLIYFNNNNLKRLLRVEKEVNTDHPLQDFLIG